MIDDLPQRPIRLVALDIDGTLIGEDLDLSPRVRGVVREAVRRDVAVVLATGRIATSAMPYARELGLTLPIIAMQGALVREMPGPGSPRLGRLLDHRTLPVDVVREAVAWSRAHGLAPHCDYLEQMFVQQDDPLAAEYERYEFGRIRLVRDLDAWVRSPVTKVICVAQPPLPTASLAEAREAFAGRADATVSHPLFLEFVAPGVSKGAALRRLARRLRIDMADVLAAGDQLNDLEMVAAAGWGVAMGHAPAELRAVARVVAPPIDEDGIADVLERLVLRQ
jgi:Cof subfamily protein (haloacid dehalogenase superfamily)